MRKPAFCIGENKDADQLRGNREADQRLVFAIRIVQSLYYLHPKFQASSHLLCLPSPVCVRPGRKHRRPVFSQRGSLGFWSISKFGFLFCSDLLMNINVFSHFFANSNGLYLEQEWEVNMGKLSGRLA